MRSIIVCGMDNTGKTTLIKKLHQVFGIEVITSCRSLPLDDQLNWIQQQVERTQPAIYDRFTLISEHVYGPILRGGSKFDEMSIQKMTWIELVRNVFESINPILIYCRPSTLSIIKTFHEREQLDGVSQNLNQLIERYDNTITNVCSITGTQFIGYDWNLNMSADGLIEKIVEMDKSYGELVALRYMIHGNIIFGGNSLER